MEQQTQKKEWKTPELIILVRSKPEEAVLAACKKANGVGPGDPPKNCNKDTSPTTPCTTGALS